MTNLINPSLVVNVYDAEAERIKINASFKVLMQQIDFSIKDAKAKLKYNHKDLDALHETLKGDVRSEQIRLLNQVKKPKLNFENYDNEIL